MKHLSIFNYQDKEIRTITDENGNPWFVGKDIANTLGYSDTDQAVRKHCKLSKLFKPVELTGFDCGPRGMVLIPEPDVYRLVSKSTLPAAEKFEVWIFEEVLPSIRKSGGYIAARVDDTNEEIMARAIMVAQDTLKRRDERIKFLETENEVMRPKALFADAVATSSTSILVGELAKLLKQNGVDIGQNRLFSWMRENGFLIKRNGTDYNGPTQKSMDMGLLEIKIRTIVNPDGSVRETKTTKVSGKGQTYFVNKFLGEKTTVGLF